jgi:hypothetical protein
MAKTSHYYPTPMKCLNCCKIVLIAQEKFHKENSGSYENSNIVNFLGEYEAICKTALGRESGVVE